MFPPPLMFARLEQKDRATLILTLVTSGSLYHALRSIDSGVLARTNRSLSLERKHNEVATTSVAVR
jgi:hypothetical protein